MTAAVRGWLLVALLAPVGVSRLQGQERALLIEEGSVAGSEVVAVGRDLQVDGEARGDVAAIQGNAQVTGRIRGSLIVLGGDARLSGDAVVDGDVYVLGGELAAAAGARIGGRAVAYPSVGKAWLTLLEGPSLGLPGTAPIVIGAKLALLAAWLLVTLFLLATGGRSILETSSRLSSHPGGDFVTGLTATVALFLTGLGLTIVAPGVLAAPLLALVVLLGLLLKLWGMVAVFHALGQALARWLVRRRLEPVNAACLGLIVLGGVKLLPWVGTVTWWVATFVGIGAALTTKFGRREPWLEAVPSAAG